jgi:hypothetical protein
MNITDLDNINLIMWPVQSVNLFGADFRCWTKSNSSYTNMHIIIDSAREHIIQVGGVQLIVRNIQQHAAVEQLTEYGLFTLGNLSIHGNIYLLNIDYCVESDLIFFVRMHPPNFSVEIIF